MSWNPLYDEKRELIGDYVLKRSEFKDYLDSDFFCAFNLWRKCDRYGLPQGESGWLKEPEAVLELIELFDAERDRLDRKELKKNANH